MSRQLSFPLRMVPMILVMGIIFFLSHQPGDSLDLPVLPGIDKLAHLAAYGALAAATLFAYNAGWKRARPWLAVLVTTIFCLLYGLTDEIHQSFIPGRAPSFFDLAADGAGAVLAGGLWLRLRAKNGWKDRLLRGVC